MIAGSSFWGFFEEHQTSEENGIPAKGHTVSVQAARSQRGAASQIRSAISSMVSTRQAPPKIPPLKVCVAKHGARENVPTQSDNTRNAAFI